MLPIKFTKEQSEFIEMNSSIIDNEWFNIPFWYHKVGENLYEQVLFENLPKLVADKIKELRECEPKH